MLKNTLKSRLKELGIPIILGKYICKSDITKVIGDNYKIPKLPNELKHGKTLREKEYLRIIEELMDMVSKDPMTGLEHKEHFQKTEKSEGVFIAIDGDGLKKINDTHGHAAGHSAILAISDGIKAALRSKDDATVQRATRSGGDEFIVHIENVTMSAGVNIANRILENIRKQKISKHYVGDADTKKILDALQLSASIGVGYTERDADEAMYQAKKKGRNRVEFQKLKAA